MTTYAPDPLTHIQLSDSMALWCSACGASCTEPVPCPCDSSGAKVKDKDKPDDEPQDVGAKAPVAPQPNSVQPENAAQEPQDAEVEAEAVQHVGDADSGEAGESHGG